MSCKVNDLNLSFDRGDRLRNTIGRLTGWNVNKAYALAGIMKSDAFKTYIMKHLTKDDILQNADVDLNEITEADYVNIKQNKFGSMLNAYYLDHYHSVDNTKTAKAMGRLNGFTSSTAKKLAKDHVADLIIDQYIEELNKPKEQRSSIARRVIDKVRNDINKEFLNRAEAFANKVIETEGYSNEAKAYAQKYIDILNRIKDASNETKNLKLIAQGYQINLRNMEKNGIKKSEAAHYNELKKNFKEAKANYDSKNKAVSQLKFDRYVLAQNLINLYTTSRDGQQKDTLRNYANLVSQVNGDPDAWFFQVYNTKKMTSLVKEFSKVDEIGEYLEQDEENDDVVEDKHNGETLDETSKSWEDSLFKNFNQSISTKMRMILSRVPKMTGPYNIAKEEQSIDTNNELGVKTYYDPTYLTVQVYSFGDFTDVNSMIESLENQARNVSAIYGLTDLTNRMKNDREFANYVYVNFAKPVVNKVMATINNISDDNGIIFDYSNPSAFTVTKLVFDMMNKLRATYNNNYDAKDIDALDEAYDKLLSEKESNVEKGKKQLIDTIRKYFPNIDATLFDNIMKGEDFSNNVDILVRNMKSTIKAIRKLKENINAEYKRINDNFNLARANYDTIVEQINNGERPASDLPDYPVKEEFDVSKRELTKEMNKAIFNMVNLISKYNESRARLNTANAEGHTASDVIKNCFITRFFDQIMAENADDSNAGLKALGNYLMQGTTEGKENQYSNNPILFGLKNENGAVIVPGMFTQTGNGGFIINNNAKDILKYALFDGVKNNNTGIGSVYQSMSKQDFFITQFIAFSKTLIDRNADGNTTDIKGSKGVKSAVYPMRVGSDAPKIFMIRAPRYNETQLKYSFYNHFLDEMNMFTTAIGNLFVKGNDDEYFMKRNLRGLVGRAYFDERTAADIRKNGDDDFSAALVKDGKLVGNMFKFNRLFKTENYDFGAAIESMLSLYGDSATNKPALFISDGNGGLKLNKDYLNDPNSAIKIVHTESGNDRFVFDPSDAMKQTIIENMIKGHWMNEFMNDANKEIADFITALENQKIPYNENMIRSFLLNTANMNMNYDDLFEGDFKYYNNARDFLKRTKETQAGGESYENTNITNDLNNIQDVQWNSSPAVIQVKQTNGADTSNYVVPTFDGTTVVDKPMVARNGWRAVTIYNTIKAVDVLDDLIKSLTDLFIKEGRTPEKAKARAEKIAWGYGHNLGERSGALTKINDAQSYITLEEFIRRKDADGTLNEYQDILAQLLDPNIDADAINLDEINARIQVQKNFYYDKVFDPETGQFIPRQIKNAEFVLIPKLLPKDSQLRKVYDWMRANDIGQLNTAETDKAAKKNVFTIWDEQTGAFDPDFESKFDNSYISNYYYQYLYKQQDVPQHMEDESNKLGSQLSKKIIDNVSTASDEVKRWANEYQDAYMENIRDSYEMFLESMGWEYDAENGRIVNRDYAKTDQAGNPLSEADIESNRTALNFSAYYARAREEAARLGMDSNFMEYLIPNEFGRSRMPNAMNNVQQKLESVAQALFNRAITRQTLPGWHAAQITGVGYSKKLNWNPETGIMEVYLPRWSKLIPKGKTEAENEAILKQIQEAGLDIHLGYRIPSEGKQSIAVLKVVGFTNEALGSTVVVPDAWVTQTGSDFDVDSIYGISWEMYTTTDKKTGMVSLHRVPFEEGEVQDESLYIRYVNSHLDNRVRRTDLGEEIDGRAKELRDGLRNINKEKKTQNKAFGTLDTERNELFKKLPAWARGIIVNVNADNGRTIENKFVVDIKVAYPQMISMLSAYLENHKVEGDNLTNVNRYIELLSGLNDIMEMQDNIAFSASELKADFSNDIKELVEQAKSDYLSKVEDAAKEAGLMSFEEFAAQPHLKKLSRRARNNYILDRMIKIMNDDSSREEQYGRSQFEDISNANELINDISGESGRLISPYNPLTQLSYFDDVMSGARLKALSVNWDTFASRCNRMHAELNEDAAIDVVLQIEGNSATNSQISYDIDDLNAAYGEDISEFNGMNANKENPYANIKIAMPMKSAFAYGNEKRDDITATDTINAIKNGERTATTRYAKHGNIEQLSKLKVGDVVKFSSQYGNTAYVRITKPLTKLSKNTNPEEWSKKEGWNIDHFNRVVKPEIEQGTAYQMEFEYLSPEQVLREQNADKESEIDKTIGINAAKDAIATLESNNGELSSEEKQFIESKLGKKPRIVIASEASDPVFHAKKIKNLIEADRKKPVEERQYNCMYLITKHDGLPLKELAELDIPKFVHFSITSLGGTKYEPGVMKMDDLLDRIDALVKDGTLRPHQVTIRIDPLVPGVTKEEDVRHIMQRAVEIGIRQFRFSVLDSYGSKEGTNDDRFVIQRMRELGYNWEQYYNVKESTGKVEFNAKQEVLVQYYSMMEKLTKEFTEAGVNILMQTCGEAVNGVDSRYIKSGMACINAKSVNSALGTTDMTGDVAKQRPGCSCFKGTDLLSYNDNCNSSCMYCYAKHSSNAAMKYYDKDGKLLDNDFTRTVRNADRSQTVRANINEYTLHSGGAKGADTAWRNVGIEFGLQFTSDRQKHYYYGKQTHNGNVRITEEEYNEGVEAVKVANRTLQHRNVRQYLNLLARDYIQVKNADAVYAIGILKENDTQVNGADWAVQMAIDTGKPVYAYDQNRKSWFMWDANNKVFKLYRGIPVLTQNFAGVGTTEITEDGIKAIRKVYDNTFNNTHAVQHQTAIDNSKRKVVLKARKFGWSNTNKNIVGDYVTTSTAETTAHHLDAVKEGSIPNVNDYTFAVYKFLTCIGLDHEFSVGFMRQPIISRLVANNNLTESVYFGGENNPIYMTIADIANDLGLKVSNRFKSGEVHEINHNTYIGDVLDVLRNNSDFIEAFENIWGININELDNNGLLNTKVPLVKDFIFARIKTAGRNKSNRIDVNKPNAYNSAAVDLGMLLLFRHMNKVADNINQYMQAANVDKIGAKPSIRETRRIRESVDQLRTDNTLTVDGKNFMDALYPVSENGSIDVEASANKPVAAAYAYSTLPSISVGQQIFIMERESGDMTNPDFVEAEKIVQERIGHRFNEQEFKEYKRYAMNYLYNRISKLFTPLTIDERGRVVPFIEDSEKGISEPQTASNYWDEERSRVVGYGIVDEGDFHCEDINNPTKDEIAKYIKLTPAQKVIFMQRNFPDWQGIFNYIKVTLLNNWDKRNRGITRQYLAYDDQVDNIEDLFDFFTRSFANNSPLVKLAAVDLIKYAFIAEGFNFRSGYITKIIPNDVLYTDAEQGGMDIIDSTNGVFNLLNELPAMLTSRNFIENYARSHSEIFKIVNIGNISYDINDLGEEVALPSQAQRFKKFTRPDGLVVLSSVLDDYHTNQLIKRLNLPRKVGHYVKVDFPVNANRRDVRLYRVEGRNKSGNTYKDYYLVPMNLLEPHESYDISYNESYNRFNTVEYYDTLVDDLADYTEAYRTDHSKDKDTRKIKYALAEANRHNPATVERIGTYSPSTGGVQETVTTPYFLAGAVKSKDEQLAGGAKIFTDAIQDELMDRVMTGNFTGLYVLNNNTKIASLIERGKYITQTVSSKDGSFTQDFTIAHVKPNNKMLIRTFNNGIKTDQERDMAAYALLQSKRFAVVPTNPYVHYYYITPVQQKESEQNDILKAATDTIVSDNSADIASQTDALARRGRDIDNVSASIIKQITYDARKNDSNIAQQFVRDMTRKGVSRNYRGSLIEHRKDVYTSAARYYRSAANSIINALNAFEIVDRETGEATTYDMSSEAMYDALAKNDQYFAEVAHIILDAVTFGNRIDAIMSLDLAFEDKATKEAIESIRNSINSVRNNTKVGMAMNNLINIYFKKYSTNPMITEGLMNIRDQFGDMDTVVKLISDPAELNNSEVQVILKEVYSMFSKAELFDTQRNVKEWQEALAKIDAMSESLDMGKIIDNERGMLRQEFNEKFLEDKQKVINDLEDAKEHRFDSVEAFERYLRAQYARDEFMYKHTEQPIMDEYYKEDLANRFEVMQQAGRAYFEYRMLSAQLYDMESRGEEETDAETANKKQRIKNRMRDLKSPVDSMGAEKDPEDKAAADAIGKFIDRRREINKKYFNTQEYDGFQQDYQRYSSFIKYYNKEHPNMSLEEKLENVEYKEAYDWVKNNGSVVFTDAAGDKLAKAFKVLVGRTTSMSKMTLAKLRKVEGAIDESGTINPLALNDAQIAQLKKAEESELGIQYANGDGEMILIKDIPSDVPLKFKSRKAVKYKQNPTKAHAIGRINEILGKAVDKDTGRIDIATVFNNDYITDAEREELAKYYDVLYDATEYDYDPATEDYMFNESAYNAAMTYYNDHLKNTKQGTQFLNIFCHYDARIGQLTYNKFIYGYKVPLDQYVDIERTEAFRFIQDNVQYVPTEYYYQAMHKATAEGRYDEWYKANHIYNAFAHKWQPLSIWTKMEAKPDSELAKSVEYVPSFDNVEKSIKPEYINNEENRKKAGLAGRGYSEFGHNYKKGDSRYDSAIKLNAKEQALKDLIQKTLNKYATTYQGRRFVGQGYLPRERSTQVNGRWALSQVAALFGASWHSGRDSDSFHETVDYSHDREADMKMLQLLKDKGTKEYEHLPNRADFDSDEEYQKELKKVREENKKIAEENRKIDAKILNRDWRKVMEDFVYNATIFNSRQAAKPYLYLLLEDLAVNNAYMIRGIWNKRLVKDVDTSTKDDPQFRRVKQNNTREVIHNLARRLLFDQYHENTKLRSVANFMQNLTSAKYMIFNLYGGIANVATGKTNIAVEEWANEYFGFNEFHAAERQYLSHSASIVASIYSDKAPNLIAALCKEFHIVDFDQILQFAATANDIDARLKQLRNFMYSFQSAGEHYMQNSVMLAMLKSNRLYTDDKGIRRIGDFKDYSQGVERQAMRDVLASNQDLLMNYEAYLNSIRAYDLQTRLDVSTGRKDLNRNFLYSLRDNKDPNMQAIYRKIAEAYQKRRNELMKNAKTEFLKNKTVESLYEYKDGKAVIKAEEYEDFKKYANNPIGDLEHLIGGFREKVKSVNKKIHGVYDKDGAAWIESKLLGSILMQYHKHLPTGIYKRWRRKGYYNEFRGSMERGSYQTFIDFLGTEFTDFKTRVGNKQENGTGVALASIQVAIESVLSTFTNLAFNYKQLNDSERANMRRILGDMGGVLTACIVAAVLYGVWDDDDIKDDKFKASLLYLADRLYSESSMYTPWGLVSEYKTAWSSPIAAGNSPSDFIKAIQILPQYFFDPDFNKEYQTGQYAGKNKLMVLLRRNIPGVRPYDRIMNITRNNDYYKIDQSQVGISWAKNFGELIND